MRVARYNNVPANYYRNNYCEQPTASVSSKVENLEKEVIIRLALPGFDKENLNIIVEDDVLTISSKADNTEDKDQKVNDFIPANFEKKYRLSDSIEVESILAKYNNGILEVSLPKKEEEKKKSLSVSIS